MANEEAEGTDESNWSEVCENLRSEIGEAAFQSWIKPMTVRSVVDGAARLSVPTRFMRDWAVAHYLDKLGILWNSIDASVHTVEVLIQRQPPLKQLRPLPSAWPQQKAAGRLKMALLKSAHHWTYVFPLTILSLASRMSLPMQPQDAWLTRLQLLLILYFCMVVLALAKPI